MNAVLKAIGVFSLVILSTVANADWRHNSKSDCDWQNKNATRFNNSSYRDNDVRHNHIYHYDYDAGPRGGYRYNNSF